jgi:hypothetical protein
MHIFTQVATRLKIKNVIDITYCLTAYEAEKPDPTFVGREICNLRNIGWNSPKMKIKLLKSYLLQKIIMLNEKTDTA